jgi:hypothetical protein
LLSVKTIVRFARRLALGCGLLFVSLPSAVAQTESALAIRVEVNQVLVPTFVFYKQRFDGIDTSAENRCVTESAKALQEKGISVRQLPSTCWGGSILDLGPKDFRLFEDGTEQTIQSVTRQRSHWWQLYDNYGIHREYSGTPTGKWSTSDLGSSDWAPPTDVEPYVIAYTPPQSTKGSCHQIKVSVDHRNVVVFNRSEYCNVQYAPSDPLEGTKSGLQVEGDLASPTKPKIPMLAASGVFFRDSGTPRVQLVLEFPWNSLHREWVDGYDRLFATIGVLGMAYRKDGTLAMRFSDQACCPRDAPSWHYGLGEAGGDVYAIPARYETQMDLPPGDYDVRVILSDGKKFGLIEIPLSLESGDKKQLDLSSVALCKRFHRVDPPSYTEGILPSKFMPLVSKGMEFTPAADTTFKKRDPLFAYFEVYEPHRTGGTAADVQFQLRITNADTGQLKIDSGSRPATEFLQPGKEMVSIVQEVAIHDLPKGNYRLEVQASDSAGNRTPWHAAGFTVR